MARKFIALLVTLLMQSVLTTRAPAGAQYPVTTPQVLGFGTPFDGDIPIVGDWDNDSAHIATVGVRRGATFFLRNANTTGAADIVFDYGLVGDRPVAGDWDGDGIYTVGVRRGAEFLLRNSNTTGQADIAVTFGLADDFPVVGDWDGNGTTTIGVYRTGKGDFYLRNSNTPGPADMFVHLDVSGPNQPVVGDWDGNNTTTVGVYKSYNAQGAPGFFARNSNTSGPPDVHLAFGLMYDAALVGDWQGDGVETPAVRRNSELYETDNFLKDVNVYPDAANSAERVVIYGTFTVRFTGLEESGQ